MQGRTGDGIAEDILTEMADVPDPPFVELVEIWDDLVGRSARSRSAKSQHEPTKIGITNLFTYLIRELGQPAQPTKPVTRTVSDAGARGPNRPQTISVEGVYLSGAALESCSITVEDAQGIYDRS